MAIATSGSIAMSTVQSVFARGYSISGYRGTQYYTSAGLGTFPTGGFPFSAFYGTSPNNEWACACDCNCNCGK